MLFHKTLDSVRLLNRFTSYSCSVIILKTLCHILFNSVLSCLFVFLLHWSSASMLTELCCTYAFSLPLAHSLGCFSSCLTPKIFCIGRSLPAAPPQCLWAPQASYCSKPPKPLLTNCRRLLQPDPTTTLPWPSLLLVLHPTVGSTPTTLPLHAPPATTIGLAYHQWLLSRPTRLQWSPNLNNNRAGECELWYTSVAINSGASVPQSARAYSILDS
jgi:hypothetical protein